MGTSGYEPESVGIFLKRKVSTGYNPFNSLLQFSVTHRSITGANHSSQVILRPQPEKGKKRNL